MSLGNIELHMDLGCFILFFLVLGNSFSSFYLIQVPFLDATNTLLYPILPLTAVDYEEFGYPGDIDDFHAIRKFSPYDNIQKDVLYPSVLVSSSFNTR